MLKQLLDRDDCHDVEADRHGNLAEAMPIRICFDLDLNVKANLFSSDDADHFDLLTLFLSGLPAGASLSRGVRLTQDAYSLSIADLEGLELRLSKSHPGVLSLRIEAIARDLLTGESVARATDIDVVCDDVTARRQEAFDPLMDQFISPARP